MSCCVQLIGAISSSGHTDDVLRELLSRATCRLLSCEAVVLYVVSEREPRPYILDEPVSEVPTDFRKLKPRHCFEPIWCLGPAALCVHICVQHDKEDSMWSMSMSTLTQRAYHSTKRSIAGHVMRTGTRVNTMTPKEHQAFDPDGAWQQQQPLSSVSQQLRLDCGGGRLTRVLCWGSGRLRDPGAAQPAVDPGEGPRGQGRGRAAGAWADAAAGP